MEKKKSNTKREAIFKMIFRKSNTFLTEHTTNLKQEKLNKKIKKDMLHGIPFDRFYNQFE